MKHRDRDNRLGRVRSNWRERNVNDQEGIFYGPDGIVRMVRHWYTVNGGAMLQFIHGGREYTRFFDHPMTTRGLSIRARRFQREVVDQRKVTP
jgi:hypothetical protein